MGSPTEFKRDAMRSESGSLGGTQYTRFNIYTLIDQSEATHGFKIQRSLAHSYACACSRVDLKVDLGNHPIKLCFEHFTSQVQLAGHNCRGIRILDYKCSICDRNFMSSANLASHMKWHDQQVCYASYIVATSNTGFCIVLQFLFGY